MTEPFGERTAWYAFATTDVERVLAHLLRDSARVVGWEEGVTASYEEPVDGIATVFVTPPIDGHVLATCRGWLAWWTDDGLSLMATNASEWSAALDCEIQYYASDRDADVCGWGRHGLEDWRDFMKRDGELLVNDGPITGDERALADAFALDPAYAETLANTRDELMRAAEAGRLALAGGGGLLERGPLVGVTPADMTTLAALVLGVDAGEVAGRWSVDPNQLDERSDLHDKCWLGTVRL